MSKNLQKLGERFITNPNDKSFKELFNYLNPKLKKIFSYKLFFDVSSLNDCRDLYIEDLVNETFLKLLLNYDKYDAKWNFSTWIYTIAKNEFLIWRKKTLKEYKLKKKIICQSDRIHKTFKSSNEEIVKDNEKSYIINYSDSPLSNIIYLENECFKNNLIKLIYKEINNLPDRYKNILFDRECKNMQYEDLAEKYDIPMQTIKNRIRLGRIKIKTKLEKYYIDILD